MSQKDLQLNPYSQEYINDSEIVNFDPLSTDNVELMMRLIDYIFWEQDRGDVIPS